MANIVFEDTKFEAADSPVIHNVNAALGKNSIFGYLRNDGPGDLLIETSNDGSNYGAQFTLTDGEIFGFDSQEGGANSIRITWSKENSAYRINLV